MLPERIRCFIKPKKLLFLDDFYCCATVFRLSSIVQNKKSQQKLPNIGSLRV